MIDKLAGIAGWPVLSLASIKKAAASTTAGGIALAALGGLTQSDVTFVSGALATIGGAGVYIWSALQREKLKNDRLRIENEAHERELWLADCKQQNGELQRRIDVMQSRIEALNEQIYRSTKSDSTRSESSEWNTNTRKPDQSPPEGITPA